MSGYFRFYDFSGLLSISLIAYPTSDDLIQKY